MKSKRKKMFHVLVIVVVFFAALILFVEIQPVSVASSSIFTTPGQTEIRMYVQMNTLLDVNEEKMTKEVITEHQMINGIQENTVYTLKLYRTAFHYKRNWEYDTIICDENGAIICCGDDLGV